MRLPLTVRNHPGRNTVVSPTGETLVPTRTWADLALLKALAQAFRWQQLLNGGTVCAHQRAGRARADRARLSGSGAAADAVATRVVEVIVDGRQGSDVILPGLMGGVEVCVRVSVKGRVISLGRWCWLHQCGINFQRPLVSRPGAEACPVNIESRSLLDHAELHAKAELRSDIKIGRAEPVPD